MNGPLTVGDKTTQQVSNQPIFIFLNSNINNSQFILSNGSLITNDVFTTPQASKKNDLPPCVNHVEGDHDCCAPDSSSCPTNNPSVAGKEGTNVLKSVDISANFISPPLPVISNVLSFTDVSNSKIPIPRLQKRKIKLCNKDICTKNTPNGQKKEKSRTCTMCSERFDTTDELINHLDVYHRFICEKCGKGFPEKTILSKHTKTHNLSKFICEVCGKVWKTSRAFRNHLQMHRNDHHIQIIQCDAVRTIRTKEKPFECELCNKKFSRKNYLRNHIRCHVDPPSSKLAHRLGYSGLNLGQSLNRPIKQNDEPVPCKLCGKSFSIAAAMKRHLVSHVKRYACKYCPLTFCARALSRRHERIHQEGDFFRCDVCWKRFESIEMLDEHSARHTNASHVCNMCGKGFNRRYLMNHHKLLDHSDESDRNKVEGVLIESLEVDEC